MSKKGLMQGREHIEYYCGNRKELILKDTMTGLSCIHAVQTITLLLVLVENA